MQSEGTPPDITFPDYPTIAELPADPTDAERLAFACRIIEEQGDKLGDYLFAAVRTASDPATMMRWAEMSEYIECVYGAPITLTYRACDRIASEKAALQ